MCRGAPDAHSRSLGRGSANRGSHRSRSPIRPVEHPADSRTRGTGLTQVWAQERSPRWSPRTPYKRSRPSLGDGLLQFVSHTGQRPCGVEGAGDPCPSPARGRERRLERSSLGDEWLATLISTSVKSRARTSRATNKVAHAVDDATQRMEKGEPRSQSEPDKRGEASGPDFT